MTQIFRQHKKLCIVLMGVLCLALVAGYLYATFLPGIWHGDAFLYDKGQGVFAGHYRKQSVKSACPHRIGTFCVKIKCICLLR